MRNLKNQPSFWALIAVLILTLSPFGFPPESTARASPLVRELLPRHTFMSIHFERTPASAQEYAFMQLPKYHWNQTSQWQCLKQLWTNESHWNPDSHNTTAVYMNNQKMYAGGIPQILGLDPNVEVTKQVRMGLRYLQYRYGSPCDGLRFWNNNFWY